MTPDPALTVGTLAAPDILRAPHPARAAFIESILAAGLDHVFVADHVSFHVGTGMDGLVNAATLTAIDSRLRVVVGVYLLALRHPVVVARQLATIAESAPGQLVLGVGVGGEDRNEFAMCGVDPRTRGRRTDESLGVLRRLLTGEKQSHQGEFYALENAWIRPAPEPAIPILIGGRSDAALRRAAVHGDGWLATWCSPQRFAAATAEIDARARDAGRPTPHAHGLQLWVGIDDDRARARARLAKGMEAFYRIPFASFEKYSPYGTPAEIAARLAAYRDAGCRMFNLMPVAGDEATGIAGIAEIRRLLRAAP
jgi:alkanesulfonate monooxygenase SsuD/methylene tetrahydromethanopterin reductase-like flavin-dependent oxidoreductase (luciferase family)